MREIIQVQIGQCGIQFGSQFNELICSEHGIDLDGSYIGSQFSDFSNAPVFFNEIPINRFNSRAIFLDNDPFQIDQLKSGPLSKTINTENCITGKDPTLGNYGKGYYGDDDNFIDCAMEAIRKESELCDSIDGFMMMHSISGGTGSGFGSLLTLKLKEEFPDKILQSVTLFPSFDDSEKIISPYNAMLSLNSLVENVDSTLCFDNISFYRIEMCLLRQNILSNGFETNNKLISQALSAATSSFRFNSRINNSMRKLACNLIPFPRMHFLASSYAPIFMPNSNELRALTVPEINQKLYDPKYFTVNTDPRTGRILSGMFNYRGQIKENSAYEQNMNIASLNSSYFVEWIPNNIKYETFKVPLGNAKCSGDFIINSTCIKSIFSDSLKRFDSMYKNRTFLSSYLSCGLDEMELIDSQVKIQDLFSEYQLYEDATIFDNDILEYDEYDLDSTADSIKL